MSDDLGLRYTVGLRDLRKDPLELQAEDELNKFKMEELSSPPAQTPQAKAKPNFGLPPVGTETSTITGKPVSTGPLPPAGETVPSHLPPEGDTLAQTVKKGIAGTGGAILKGAAGVIRSGVENLGTDSGISAVAGALDRVGLSNPGIDMYRKSLSSLKSAVGMDTATKPVLQGADAMSQAGEKINKENLPKYGTPYSQEMLQSALTSAGLSLSALGATVVTKNPAIGLTLMGMVSGGGQYEEARKAGFSPEFSQAGAAINGAIEVATEKLPFDRLLAAGEAAAKKSVAGWLGNSLASYGFEVPGELLATLGQDAVAKVTQSPNMTPQDLAQDLKDTFWSTLLMGPIQGAAVGVAGAARASITRSDIGPTSFGGYIETHLPGSTVTETEYGAHAVLPNGTKVEIHTPKSERAAELGKANIEAIRAGYGDEAAAKAQQEMESGGTPIKAVHFEAGSEVTKDFTDSDVIFLSGKADITSLPHEIYHLVRSALRTVLTEAEITALETDPSVLEESRQTGRTPEEVIAERYGVYAAQRNASPSNPKSPLEKAFAKVVDFFHVVWTQTTGRETTRGVFEKIRTGQAIGREGVQGTAPAGPMAQAESSGAKLEWKQTSENTWFVDDGDVDYEIFYSPTLGYGLGILNKEGDVTGDGYFHDTLEKAKEYAEFHRFDRFTPDVDDFDRSYGPQAKSFRPKYQAGRWADGFNEPSPPTTLITDPKQAWEQIWSAPNTFEEYKAAVSRGKLNLATGKPAPMRIGSQRTDISLGLSEGYTMDDILHYYARRAGYGRAGNTEAQNNKALKQGWKEFQKAGIIEMSGGYGPSYQIGSPAFKKWFGKSKVVDKSGKPKMMVHLTDAEFSTFRTPAWFGDFSYHEEAMSIGTERSAEDIVKTEGPLRSIPVWLKIENPYRADFFPDERSLEGDGTYSIAEDPYNQDVIDDLISKGYDGMVSEYVDDTEVYVAFYPWQIKSVFNSGPYSKKNNDISYQMDEKWWEDPEHPDVTQVTLPNGDTRPLHQKYNVTYDGLFFGKYPQFTLNAGKGSTFLVEPGNPNKTFQESMKQAQGKMNGNPFLREKAQLEKVEAPVTKSYVYGKTAVRIFSVSIDHEVLAKRPPGVPAVPIQDPSMARQFNTTRERVKDWQEIYRTDAKNEPVYMKLENAGKLEEVPVIAITRGCQRARTSVERVRNGLLPNETLIESCYGGDCWFNLTRFFKQNGQHFGIDTKDLTISSPAQIARFFANPKNLKWINDAGGKFIRMGQQGDDSHAIASGSALAWFEGARKAGIKKKTVMISSGYAPVTDAQYRALAPYAGDMEIHFTVSGWFHPNEILLRLGEFQAAKDAGLPAFVRFITNADNISGVSMPNEEFALNQMRRMGITNSEILETPFHDDGAPGAPRSEPSGLFENICCETGKCKTCGVKCMTQVPKGKKRKTAEANYQLEDDPTYTPERKDPFFSKVMDIVQTQFPETLPSKDVLPILKKYGAKNAEIVDLGLNDYLNMRSKVDRNDLLNFISENQIQVEEVFLMGEVPLDYDTLDWFKGNGNVKVAWDKNYNGYVILENNYTDYARNPDDDMPLVFQDQDEAEKAAKDVALLWDADENPYGTKETTYDDYTTPGGNNYREILLITRPKVLREWDRKYNELDKKIQREMYDAKKANLPVASGGTHKLLKERASTALKVRELERSHSFESQHWTHMDIFLHARVKDRTGPNNEKILDIEEIQSDWTNARREFEKEGGDRIPAMPYSGDWKELAVRRMLVYAAQNGYDGISWVTGEQTRERYGLANKVDAIIATPVGDVEDERGRVDTVVYRIDQSGNYVLRGLSEGKFVGEYTARKEDIEKYVWSWVAEQIIGNKGRPIGKRELGMRAIKDIPFPNGMPFGPEPEIFEPDTFHLEMIKKGDKNFAEDIGEVKKEDLAKWVGKDLAQRIIDRKGKGFRTVTDEEYRVAGLSDRRNLGIVRDPGSWKYKNPHSLMYSGVDLEIGGEWALHLYDKIVPGIFERFGKKYGATVQTVDLDEHERVEANTLAIMKEVEGRYDDLYHGFEKDGFKLYLNELEGGGAVVELYWPDGTTSEIDNLQRLEEDFQEFLTNNPGWQTKAPFSNNSEAQEALRIVTGTLLDQYYRLTGLPSASKKIPGKKFTRHYLPMPVQMASDIAKTGLPKYQIGEGRFPGFPDGKGLTFNQDASDETKAVGQAFLRSLWDDLEYKQSHEETQKMAEDLIVTGRVTEDTLAGWGKGVAFPDAATGVAATMIATNSWEYYNKVKAEYRLGNVSRQDMIDLSQKSARIVAGWYNGYSETARSLEARKIVVAGMEGAQVPVAPYLTAVTGTVTDLAARFDTGDIPLDDFLDATDYIPSMYQAAVFYRGLPDAKDLSALNKLFYFSLLSNPVTQAANLIGNVSPLFINMSDTFWARLFGGKKGGVEGLFAGMWHGTLEAWILAKRAWKTGLSNYTAKFDDQDYFPKTNITGIDDAREAIVSILQDKNHPFNNPSDPRFPGAVRTLRALQRVAYDPISKERMNRLTGERLDWDGPWLRFLDYIGRVVDVPFRGLNAGDEFFKVLNERMMIYKRAYEEAYTKYPNDPAGFKRFVADFVQNPPGAVKEMAHEFAQDQTFTGKMGLVASHVAAVTSARPVFKLFVPFVRIISNITKFGLHHTPVFAALSQEVRDDLKGLNGETAKQLAYARMATGASMMLTFAGLAMAGLITGGGPLDKKKRDLLRKNLGWQEYSFRFPGSLFDDGKARYWSYKRIEPIATPMGVSADMVEMISRNRNFDSSELALMGVLSAVRNVTSKTYLKGVADTLDFITNDREFTVKKIGANMAGFVVPAFVAQMQKVLDPVKRDITDEGLGEFVNKWKSRTPGLSDVLPEELNLKGDPIENYTYSTPWKKLLGMVNPFIQSIGKDDPVAQEMVAHGVAVSMPSRYLEGSKPASGFRDIEDTGEKVGVALPPEVYWWYVKQAGNDLKMKDINDPPGTPPLGAWDRLTMIVQDKLPVMSFYDAEKGERVPLKYSDLSDGPDGSKAMVIKRVIGKYRSIAKKILESPDPSMNPYTGIADATTQKKIDKKQALMPPGIGGQR